MMHAAVQPLAVHIQEADCYVAVVLQLRYFGMPELQRRTLKFIRSMHDIAAVCKSTSEGHSSSAERSITPWWHQLTTWEEHLHTGTRRLAVVHCAGMVCVPQAKWGGQPAVPTAPPAYNVTGPGDLKVVTIDTRATGPIKHSLGRRRVMGFLGK